MVKKTDSRSGEPRSFAPALVAVAILLVAGFIPTTWLWGVNSISFLPIGLRVLLIALAGFVAYRFAAVPKPRKGAKPPGGNAQLVIIGCSLVALIVYAAFPIASTIFGDELKIRAEAQPTSIEWRWWLDALGFSFGSREALTMAIHRTISVITGNALPSVFQTISVLAGVGFVAIWSSFVMRSRLEGSSKALLISAALFSGASLIFFRQVEVYAMPVLASLCMHVLALRWLSGRGKLWHLIVVFVLAVKLHTITAVFLPALIFVVLSRSKEGNEREISWGKIAALVVPFIVVGLVLYLFVFQSWSEPFTGPVERQFYRSFLPMVSAAPPLDRYTMFSLSHIGDFLNVLLFVVGVPLAVAAFVIVTQRRSMNWSSPELKFGLLAVIFPTLFFFAMNPSLSIMRDWNIYALMLPPMLTLLYALINNTDNERARRSIPYASTFGALGLASFIVYSSPKLLSDRLFDAALHVHKTSYAGASYIMSEAVAIGEPERRNAQVDRFLQSLDAEAREGDNKERASMWMWRAKIQDADRDYPGALQTTEHALSIAPNEAAVLRSAVNLTKAMGMQQKYQEYSERLRRAESTPH